MVPRLLYKIAKSRMQIGNLNQNIQICNTGINANSSNNKKEFSKLMKVCYPINRKSNQLLGWEAVRKEYTLSARSALGAVKSTSFKVNKNAKIIFLGNARKSGIVDITRDVNGTCADMSTGNVELYTRAIKNILNNENTLEDSKQVVDIPGSTGEVNKVTNVEDQQPENTIFTPDVPDLELDHRNIQNDLNDMNQPDKNSNKVIGGDVTTKIGQETSITYRNGKPEKFLYYCHFCNTDKKLTRTQLIDHYNIHPVPGVEVNRAYLKKAVSKKPREKRPEIYRCEICSSVMANDDQLTEHYDTHDDQFSCETCGVGFKILFHYIIHLQTHSSDQLYRCTLCGVTKETAPKIKHHLYYMHEHFKKFKCDVCGKGFTVYSFLQQHMNIHNGATPFQCDECGLSFPLLNYLRAHKLRKHVPKTKAHTCTICKRSFHRDVFLTRHYKTVHQTQAVYICDVCGKKCVKLAQFKSHKSIHSENKPFKCRFCEKCFRTNPMKLQHERIHTGEKPYKCPYCEKGFSQHTSMVRHSKLHKDDELYICNVCEQKFYFKNDIINHFKTQCTQNKFCY